MVLMQPHLRGFVAVAGFLGVALSAYLVRAQTSVDEPPPFIAALRGDVGVGSAIGAVGAALVIAPLNHAQIEVGTGLGVSGVQVSLMPKLTIGNPQDHFIAGAGVSLAFPWRATSATGHPVWLNVDAAGYEHMSKHGFAFLVAVGLTGGLGGGKACDFRHNAVCDDSSQLTDVTNIWVPQFRLGFGYAF